MTRYTRPRPAIPKSLRVGPCVARNQSNRFRLSTCRVDGRTSRPFARRRRRSQRYHDSSGVARIRQSLETTSLCPAPAFRNVAAFKRVLQRGLKNRVRSVVLFNDATILTETPPLQKLHSLRWQIIPPILEANAATDGFQTPRGYFFGNNPSGPNGRAANGH